MFKPIFSFQLSLLVLSCAIAPTPPLSAAQAVNSVSPEIATLDNLIQITEQSLHNQQGLKKLMQEYQVVHDKIMQNPDNKEELFQMIKLAQRLLNSIKENHLANAFSQDFISELTVYSQIASKKGIPTP